jgi:predicted DNA-binding protein (MmcQ/YjbR family)
VNPEETRRRLLAYALDLPEAWEDSPWDHAVAKVRKKVFLFTGEAGEGLAPRITVKLPESGDHALSLAQAEPAGYGLGRSGWVSIQLAPGVGLPPLDVLIDWVEESYRAVAPKTLVKQLDQRPDGAGESSAADG